MMANNSIRTCAWNRWTKLLEEQLDMLKIMRLYIYWIKDLHQIRFRINYLIGFNNQSNINSKLETKIICKSVW